MNDRNEIGFKIKKVDNALLKKADADLNHMEITFAQHHVLIYLVHQENHTSTFKEVEKHFKVSQATTAGIIKRLEEKKYIECFTCTNDKRIKLLKLTDAGLKVCEDSKKTIDEREAKMKSIFSKQELNDFEEYLDRLYDFLSKEEN